MNDKVKKTGPSMVMKGIGGRISDMFSVPGYEDTSKMKDVKVTGPSLILGGIMKRARGGTVMKKDGNQPVTMAMGGGMMYNKGGKAKGKMKKAKLAAMYGDPNKITRGDIITAAKKKGMKKPKKGKK